MGISKPGRSRYYLLLRYIHYHTNHLDADELAWPPLPKEDPRCAQLHSYFWWSCVIGEVVPVMKRRRNLESVTTAHCGPRGRKNRPRRRYGSHSCDARVCVWVRVCVWRWRVVMKIFYHADIGWEAVTTNPVVRHAKPHKSHHRRTFKAEMLIVLLLEIVVI